MATAPPNIPSSPHLSSLDAEKLGARITELCAHIYAATYQLLVLIREFDEQGGWHQPGLCSCAHWLNFKCGIGMNAAREKVRVAHALKDLPKISAAFEKGELSYSKVRAMTRIADAGNEDYLMMIANHGTAYHVEKLVSKYRQCQRLQDTEVANRQHKDRRLSYYYDADGCLIIKGRLPAEQGALIVKALERALDGDATTAVVVGAPSGANEVTDVSVEPPIAPEGAPTTAAVVAAEPEPIGARRADALADIAETYLNTDENRGSTADRYQVVIHVSAETPGAIADAGNAHDTHIEDGPHVSAETSKRVACDCSRLGILEDADGEPLSIGRKSRSIPPAIRRALRFRDKGCRFPGCTLRRFVDGHHVKHWADGGETRLDNLVQLCRHHHRLVHEGGYGCERTGEGQFVFTAPDRGVLPASEPLPTVDLDQDPRQWLDRAMTDLEIDPPDCDSQTCVPDWHAGETMDWDLAVAALFQGPSRPH